MNPYLHLTDVQKIEIGESSTDLDTTRTKYRLLAAKKYTGLRDKCSEFSRYLTLKLLCCQGQRRNSWKAHNRQSKKAKVPRSDIKQRNGNIKSGKVKSSNTIQTNSRKILRAYILISHFGIYIPLFWLQKGVSTNPDFNSKLACFTPFFRFRFCRRNKT